VPSTKANIIIHNHANQLFGWGFPINAATMRINTPAGINLTPAINRGVVWGITPFMATIAVPQRKKGAINSREVMVDLDPLSSNSMDK
jgi:hypothetical protein